MAEEIYVAVVADTSKIHIDHMTTVTWQKSSSHFQESEETKYFAHSKHIFMH